MRTVPFVLSVLSVLLSPPTAARAADVEFVRVWPGWRDAESFERIGEYFGRSASQGGEVVLRTHAGARAGYYFLVRVKNTLAVAAATFELRVIRPDALEPTTFTFSTALPAKETVFQLGLTGSDWPEGKKTHPVAWKLALLGGDGRVLAEQKSFLWEKPAK